MSTGSDPAPAPSENVARSAGIVSIAVFLSRITGLVREKVMAHYFGAGFVYDAFLLGFRIPNLTRDLFGRGHALVRILSSAYVSSAYPREPRMLIYWRGDSAMVIGERMNYPRSDIGATRGGDAEDLEDIRSAIASIIRPRIIACVAGAYPGGRAHALSGDNARAVMRITRTNACIIHVSRDPRRPPTSCIPISELVDAFADRDAVVPLINTSRAATAEEAHRMIEAGRDYCGCGDVFRHSPLIKLEILDENLATVYPEVLRCVRQMPPHQRRRCIPMSVAEPGAVAYLCELGCPAIRVAAGKIGQQTGIINPHAVHQAIRAAGQTPVILECGFSTAEDILLAARLGAQAVLVNSAFALADDPRAKAVELREASDRAWDDEKV